MDSICSFDFFQDIAGIYLKVDTEYIMPGFTMVNQLGQSTDDSEVERKKAALARYSASAQKGILDIIDAVRSSSQPSRYRILIPNRKSKISSAISNHASTLSRACSKKLPCPRLLPRKSRQWKRAARRDLNRFRPESITITWE